MAHDGLTVARARLGDEPAITTVRYGETIDMNGVRVSLHPAGHILGSAQVRLENGGTVWVVSGDYKVEPDLTCASLFRSHVMSLSVSARSVSQSIAGRPRRMCLQKSSRGGAAIRPQAARVSCLLMPWANHNEC